MLLGQGALLYSTDTRNALFNLVRMIRIRNKKRKRKRNVVLVRMKSNDAPKKKNQMK